MNETSQVVVRPSEHRSFLGPAWRYELAKSLVSEATAELANSCDPLILEARDYLIAVDKKGSAAAQLAYPSVSAAQELQADTDKTSKLMMMVLADMPRQEISQRVGLETAVLECWEGIHFDCRDLREATSWLGIHVIEEARRSGNLEMSSRLMLAIVAGPVAVRAMLDSDAGLPLGEADRLFERRVKLHLKVDMATEMVVSSPREAGEFLKRYMEMHVECERLKLAGEKLAQQCVRSHENHELEKLRIKLRRERVASQTAKRRQLLEKRQQRQAAAEATRKVAHELEANWQRAERQDQQLRLANSPLATLKWTSEVASDSQQDFATPAGTYSVSSRGTKPPAQLPSGQPLPVTAEAQSSVA